MNINNLLHNTIVNNTDINILVESYYSIENYNFTNDDILKEHIFDNFNTIDKDLIILNKEDFINSYMNYPEQIITSDNGLILFDLSMAIDEQLYTCLNTITTNYKNINLHKFDDNYIIEFDTREIKQIDSKLFQNNLKSYFTNDLNNLLLNQRVNNIPTLIQNEQFYNKIKEDLTFLNAKSYSNLNIVSNERLEQYINNISINLNSSDYKVIYVFEDEIKQIDKELYDKILDKLKEFNTYIDDIVIQINNINKLNSNNIITLTKPSSNKQINVQSLFNQTSLNDIYLNNNYNLILKMDDVLDQNINIDIKSNTHISEDKFYNNIFKFLNELIKRKILKVIKINNIIQLN